MRRRVLLTAVVAGGIAVGGLVLAGQTGTGGPSSPEVSVRTSAICNGNAGTFVLKASHLPLRGEGNYVLNVAKGDHIPMAASWSTESLTVDRYGNASSKEFKCPSHVGEHTATIVSGNKEIVSTTFTVSRH